MNIDPHSLRGKQEIHGSTVYVNNEGNLVVEHSSGIKVITDKDGNITTINPNGTTTRVAANGESESKDTEGSLVHYADKGQKYKITKDGSFEM